MLNFDDDGGLGGELGYCKMNDFEVESKKKTKEVECKIVRVVGVQCTCSISVLQGKSVHVPSFFTDAAFNDPPLRRGRLRPSKSIAKTIGKPKKTPNPKATIQNYG